MNENLIPKYAFFVSGTGQHTDRLQAFDRALLAAGPIAHNLVAVSSILPANCSVITAEEGFAKLTPGQIVFCVMAKSDTNQPGEWASAAVGVVKSKDKENIGYISEYHGNTEGEAQTVEIAKKLALEMYENKLNRPEDLELDFLKATPASVQNTNGQWVCAISLCIFAF